nr:hypothetical protein [Tanacetum cinerariifolium]
MGVVEGDVEKGWEVEKRWRDDYCVFLGVCHIWSL